MTADLIDGARIAADIRQEVANQVDVLKSTYGIVPKLGAILVGDDPASAVYVRNKERAANEAGMLSEVRRFSSDITQERLLDEVASLNSDPTLHGYITQLPLPSHIDEDEIISSISPEKDIDGLNPVNIGRLVMGRPVFVPATPAGIKEMLLRSGHNTEGKHVVVCGRSNIVGKPVANLLLQRTEGANATVTVCHTRTTDLREITRTADILIAAIGQPNYVTADMVSDGVVVIDVGINRVDAPERKRGYKLVGDVDFEGVSAKASAITPVPGGVGPMTIAMLLRGVLKAAGLTVKH
ncbi:MAG: bifunctional 5,10-methylenetetrahydrofolate dehydrogenase/5,10-methenyltetrahydrofolate cyclohydrolase [Chloroflexota bacterium]|nr:bifunctional 5,10-methylenetetrahydrofolate dehydrogenase/5,10-methenyltetrahydrofolate cyclohydrolase [Chloroflexota bacterium]